MPPTSTFRRLLLLYRPSHGRAWPLRLFFYAWVFLVVPFFSVAALGAYVGPDQTLGGLPALLAIVLTAFALRGAAVFADGRLRPARVATTEGAGTLESLPFPLAEPPRRRPLVGLLASGAGSLLLIAGFFALGRIADRGLALREWGRRLRAVDGRALLHRNPGRPPVLLLRSFGEDEMREARPLNFFMRRYEESLSRTLGRFGPVITIGRPGEELGFLGAGRLYVSDAHWQRAVRHVMRRAGAVVIIVGTSEGLWWEISEVFKLVSRDRLLFIFPYAYAPDASGSWTKSSFFRAWNVPVSLGDTMERERRERYEEFRLRTEALVPEDMPRELGKAIGLDFAPDGRARLLLPRYPSALRYLLGPLAGTNVMADLLLPRYRFDMSRTVQPFVDKLYQVGG